MSFYKKNSQAIITFLVTFTVTALVVGWYYQVRFDEVRRGYDRIIQQYQEICLQTINQSN